MSTYKDSGVDIDAGDRVVELMKASIAKASRPEVVGSIGGFAGLFDASKLKDMKQPLLATSTDGVGTKTEIARALGKYDTIGEDLVAMVVDDLVVCGAEPLFMTDYIAVGKVVPENIADIVAGIARGCAKANTALIGGETAEHPGLLDDDEFDIAGAATGVVDADRQLGAHRVKAGDVIIGMPLALSRVFTEASIAIATKMEVNTNPITVISSPIPLGSYTKMGIPMPTKKANINASDKPENKLNQICFLGIG